MSTDMMARCGIMHHMINLMDNRFCGRMFVINRPGFTFPQYLSMMFPPPSSTPKKSRIILNEMSKINISTAEKREFTAQGVTGPLKPLNLMKHMSVNGNGVNGNEEMMMKNRAASWNMMGAGNDSVMQARMCAKECEGKTVRQLSRLWRYAGGMRPAGEGVGMVNGVGDNIGLGISMENVNGNGGKWDRAHGVM